MPGKSAKLDIPKINRAQHDLRAHFDPFFAALHNGLKHLDKIVRAHEKKLAEERSAKGLVQEWFKDTQSKQRVEKIVQDVLDENLPETYDRALCKTKCDEVFALVFRHASHGRKWAA